MDVFGLVWLSSVRFDEVDFLKCSRSASQLSFTNLFLIARKSLNDFNPRFSCISLRHVVGGTGARVSAELG